MKAVEAGYMEQRRTIWQRLGFGECVAPFMDDEDFPDFCESRLTIDSFCTIGYWDRVRILVSGRLKVAVSVKTDVPVSRSLAQSKVSILPPGRSSE